MGEDASMNIIRTRSDSDSTINPAKIGKASSQSVLSANIHLSVQANLSIHNEAFSKEQVLFTQSCLQDSDIQDGDLVEIQKVHDVTAIRDFEAQAPPTHRTGVNAKEDDQASRYGRQGFLCVVKIAPSDQSLKSQEYAVSMHKSVATTFGFTSPSQIVISKANTTDKTSSHVELCFRDAYLSRSDMWRFASQELVGRTVYVGQRITFLNSLKATVRSIHLHGSHAHVAYFGNETVPVFRSEAARYVIFIQMSREMWDFDSEGGGEILFNRVVNGFLPDLFKRWSSMEVRHLVSIVMFGRLEYRRVDMLNSSTFLINTQESSTAAQRTVDHQDFYRVVVTDMASAQWATIIDELKRDFRVFLRDVSLFETPENTVDSQFLEAEASNPTKITGRLSGALKGNILEAINLAASQFSDDHLDRDLIRTGISTVVVTAGSGVFDVDKDLLKLTSETLTNNGVGIDIVCLSRMPLHSVPLFRYRIQDIAESMTLQETLTASISTTKFDAAVSRSSLPDTSSSPMLSSTSTSLKYFSRFPAAAPPTLPQVFGYGIPQWIDLSYWSPDSGSRRTRIRSKVGNGPSKTVTPFIPRVRMYELQMMGLMELGMADISVPYLGQSSAQSLSSFRTWTDKGSKSPYARSISRSPELKRKSPAAGVQQRFTAGVHHTQPSTKTRTLEAMDDYDSALYGISRYDKSVRSKKKYDTAKIPPNSLTKVHVPKPPSVASKRSTNSFMSTPDIDASSDTESVVASSAKPSRPSRAPRNFSYGSRGLTLLKATAVTSGVHTENIKAQKQDLAPPENPHITSRPTLISKNGSSLKPFLYGTLSASEAEDSSRPSTPGKNEEASKPIKINPVSAVNTLYTDSLTKQMWQQLRTHRGREDQDAMDNHDTAESDDDDDDKHISHMVSSIPNSIPESTIPYLRNVNASNPLKRKSNTGIFGRWQHLYPRKPQAAKVKWRSLCTPASVPLTTEDFPSHEEFDNDYEGTTYTVKKSDLQGSSDCVGLHAIFLEMLSLRIAHGYQFVTGANVSSIFGVSLQDCYSIMKTTIPYDAPRLIILTMANTIQKLELHEWEIKVTKYIQRSKDQIAQNQAAIGYKAYMRTILANDYFPRQLVMNGFSEQYPWPAADDRLAGNGIRTSQEIVQFKYWRARYVLLPVEPPTTSWKKYQAEEDEEEIRLLGIRALTQQWQKNRFLTAAERSSLQSRTGPAKRLDENPLEVKMETVNLSEMVALELDRLVQTEEGNRDGTTQLLPGMQKLDRESGTLKIAQAMQGSVGIEIRSRRWHLRLYQNCFHGEEFTNWLICNVGNISTREEAVAFGNQLMKEGLFEHVNGRHDFKDGTYFYSIKQQFRVPRAGAQKPWFLPGRQSDKSTPVTPSFEHLNKEFTFSNTKVQSNSNIAHQLNSATSSGTDPWNEKQRKAICLSRTIRVDVDPKKRSFLGRSEIVDVHYDRFHNPENCYHLELNWINTTCKLVDDAITSWTNTVERYGLKLVEVPLAEACDVPITEPFRNPYRIKLAFDPAKQKDSGINFNPVSYSGASIQQQSSSTVPVPDKYLFQKAILKRSNFVLDFEAAHEFPEDVDINYSWGKHEYKHTQFVHRSGVVLAQIMHDGDIILLANRLYNSRLANAKEVGAKASDLKRDLGPQALRPAVPPSSAASMQASGIVGMNLASPSAGKVSSPGFHAVSNLASLKSPSSALSSSTSDTPGLSRLDGLKPALVDSFGPTSSFAATGLWNTLITPEQIKGELEKFCQDKHRLELFHRECTHILAPVLSGPGGGSRKNNSASSSALLGPTRLETSTSDITAIPAFELPEALTAVRQLRRATVAYDTAMDAFDRSRVGSRNGSVGSGGNGHERPDFGSGLPMSPLRRAAK